MSSTSTAVPHDTTNPPSNSSPPPKNPSPRSPSLNLGATQSLGKAPTTSSSMQNLRSSVSLGGSSKPSPSAGGKIRTAGLSQQNLPATFAATLKENCPPLPPQLLRKLSTKDTATSVGKVSGGKNSLNMNICRNQGLLYHRTCKPDFLSSWPSLNSYQNKGKFLVQCQY